MLELLGTIFSGVFAGGATGLLGVLLQRFFDYRKAKTDLELAALQLKAAKETREMELQYQERMAARVAEVQEMQAQLDAHTKEVEADAKLVADSYQHDRPTFTLPADQRNGFVAFFMGIVDFIRGLTRPALTAYTMVLLTLVFIWVREMYAKLGVQMTPAQVHDLAMQCVGTIFYLATTTSVWWFGVRPGQPPKAR